MITQRTKVQLLIFVVITLVGVTFVGARYARLDRLILDDSYRVAAHFADSGGIFSGAEVSYRGVTVGQVGELVLTEEGVDVMLDIDDDSAPIPAETKAVVANRSAVGEQYVDLQPQTDDGPYLEDGGEIATAMTQTPIPPMQWLGSLDRLARSVDKQDMVTVTSELGKAFKGTGQSLGQIIDTSNSFIETANAHSDVTTALLEDGNTVLTTQLEQASAIQSFARDLSLFSETMVRSDADLRRVIDNGSATADQLRSFLERNEVDLGDLFNNMVTTGEVTGRHIDGTRMILIAYPYVVAGGYTVLGKDPRTGLYDAHFGLITKSEPHVCTKGYESTDDRGPQDRGNRPMNMKAHCAEPQETSNARGAQNSPKYRGMANRAPVVAAYDAETGTVEWTDRSPDASISYTGGAAATFGEESWKWLLLQPVAGR